MKHGYLLGEHIKTGKYKKRNYDDGTPHKIHLRGFLFPLVLCIVAGIFFWQLFTIQIVKGGDYRALADSNRVRTQIIHAPRGIIFDRNGVPLVLNTPGFRQILNCNQKTQTCETAPLSQEEAIPLIARGERNIEVDSFREYPYKDALAHILGYIGQISEDELKSHAFTGYQGTDWIGKNGIERSYEQLLKGKDGRQLIEVDATGKPMRSLGKEDPIPGQDVILTIDSKLQEATYEATKEIRRGVVVVSKPNGEILALVSRPSFDPNLFTLDKTYEVSSTSAYENLQEVLTDTKMQPLLNRAIGGVYPPGSTFKIITSAAGIEKGIIDANYRIEDTGVLRVGEFSYANWYFTQYGKKEPGKLDVTRALARSNDIFYYKLAEKVNVDRLADMAKTFGAGSKLGIDLGGEVTGNLPTKQWKKDNIGENWYLGDTFHYGIGQGYMLATPLQVHTWGEVIANGGILYQPRLNKNQETRIKNYDFLSDKTVALIREGMIQSCTEGKGVAYPLYNFGIKKQDFRSKVDGKNYIETASGSAKMIRIPVACKTGTAQHGGDETLPHAWITTFAPAYTPEVVVTVLVEESGEGSQKAAPVAKKVLEAYFSN